VSGILYLLVAALAGFGLVRTLKSQARTRKYLEEGKEDGPLRVDHLSRPLQSLAQETRALRVSLEGPVRQLEDQLGASLDTVEMDAALAATSRELGDWTRSLAGLTEDDRARLDDMGAEPEKVRILFADEGWILERRRGWKHLHDRLKRISRELEALETRLQLQTDPYR
jgi:hypothetical protein